MGKMECFSSEIMVLQAKCARLEAENQDLRTAKQMLEQVGRIEAAQLKRAEREIADLKYAEANRRAYA